MEQYEKGEKMAGILNIQISPTLRKKDINMNKIEHFIKKNSDKELDLVVIPEFFSTGIDHNSFLNEPENEQGGEVVKKLCNLAKKYHTNIIAGTVIEKSKDKLHNTSFAINRDGEIVAKYRKIHLYNYMGGTEGERITAGEEEIVVNFDFAKVGIGICYDIRYPLHYKKLTKMGAEIIVLPTAWIVPSEIYDNAEDLKYAQDMWVAMNRTRAFDNMVYVVSSNQTGKINDNIGAIGTSLIISPTAQILANAKDKQCAIYAQIDVENVKYLKSLYPIAEID